MKTMSIWESTNFKNTVSDKPSMTSNQGNLTGGGGSTPNLLQNVPTESSSQPLASSLIRNSARSSARADMVSARSGMSGQSVTSNQHQGYGSQYDQPAKSVSITKSVDTVTSGSTVSNPPLMRHAARSSFHGYRTESRGSYSLAHKLFLQQLQSKEDSEWLHQEEDKLVKLTGEDEKRSQSRERTNSLTDSGIQLRVSRSPSADLESLSPELQSPSNQCDADQYNNIPLEALSCIELSRDDDTVYSATTDVVRTVMEMMRDVTSKPEATKYLGLVMGVGTKLRTLLSSVDSEVKRLPSETHNEIEMAHKVLSADMAELIKAMKLAQQYSQTLVVDAEYRKAMLQAAHVIAVDSKNLLDTVDIARKKHIYVSQHS